MKKIILCAICCSIFFYGCGFFESGSSIKGKVVDIISGKPIEGITIMASTKTDIEEDKKYEQITTQTDNNGEFHLKGLSSSYKYTIYTKKEGYSTDAVKDVAPPEKGKTKILEKPFKITNDPIVAWFDRVDVGSGSGRAQCSYGGGLLKVYYDKSEKVRNFIPNYIIDSISFDDVNNNLCLYAGVSYDRRSFYMGFLRNAWFKIKAENLDGWVMSKDISTDYYGFKYNYEKKWAYFPKGPEIICYNTPYDKAKGVKSGMCFWGGKHEIFKIKDGWVNLHKPDRRDGFWAPKKLIEKIEAEPAKPWNGKIISDKAYVYIEPNSDAKTVGNLNINDQVSVLEKIDGEKYTGFKSINYSLSKKLCGN